MKKVLLPPSATILIAAMFLLFSFKQNNIQQDTENKKHLFPATYCYDVSTNVKISPGFGNSILPFELSDISYWESCWLGSHGNSDHIKAIQFDNMQLTPAQAIQAVKNYYVNHSNTLPWDNSSFLEDITGHNYSISVFRMP
jgi:hypothetical protein